MEKVMIGVGDHAQFHLDESWRGLGLLCDLGYASMRLVRDCEQHNVRHVMRLKDSWKPKVLAVARGTLTKTFTPGTDLDVLIEEAEWDRLADRLNRKTDSSWRSRPSVLDQNARLVHRSRPKQTRSPNAARRTCERAMKLAKAITHAAFSYFC